MIYFDNAATTPISDTARQAAFHAMNDLFGNPSSPHALGIASEHAVTKAARTISRILRCPPETIVFTSGGTESNNLALLGAARRLWDAERKRQKKSKDATGGHILATPQEHPSVTGPLQVLAEAGFEITYAAPEVWPVYLTDNTVLVSCMQVNNETGAINDVRAIATAVKQYNPHIAVHVDGVQGFCKQSGFSLEGVDMYTFSGHKIHAPKGVGGLMTKIPLKPLLYGGGQQRQLRPGTENTTGIVAMAASAQALWATCSDNEAHVIAVKRRLLDCLTQHLAPANPNVAPPFTVEGDADRDSPYILSLRFDGVKGEPLTHMLSERGVYVSMGAACHTTKKRLANRATPPAIPTRPDNVIRFSFSAMNTVAEAETAACAVAACVQQLRMLTGRA